MEDMEINNIKIHFYDFEQIESKEIKFTATITRYKDSWVYVQHKERKTWDIPGGHVEEGENLIESAKRELFEESGASKYTIEPMCVYSVSIGNTISFGGLFFAEVETFSELPDMEMNKVEFFSTHPTNLTYPDILPVLQNKVEIYIGR